MRRLVVRGVIGGMVWVGGGGGCCRVWGLVMGFVLVVAGGVARGVGVGGGWGWRGLVRFSAWYVCDVVTGGGA